MSRHGAERIAREALLRSYNDGGSPPSPDPTVVARVSSGSVSPLILQSIPAGSVVFLLTVLITSAFAGRFQLGTAATPNAFLDLDPNLLGNFSSDELQLFGAPEQLIATFPSGGEATILYQVTS